MCIRALRFLWVVDEAMTQRKKKKPPGYRFIDAPEVSVKGTYKS